jgi:RNA polymerase sigma factor (sigma-70 family)
MQNKTELFESVKPFMISVARQFSQQSGIDFDDCLSDCYFAFAKSIDRYNPEKYKLTTFMHTCCRNQMLDSLRAKKATHIDVLAEPCAHDAETITNDHAVLIQVVSDAVKNNRKRVKDVLSSMRQHGYSEKATKTLSSELLATYSSDDVYVTTSKRD